MKRLTVKAPSGLIHLKHNDTRFKSRAIKVLSDYEDAGLTPEEVQKLKERDTAKTPIPSKTGLICPICGERAAFVDKFCGSCGQRFEED